MKTNKGLLITLLVVAALILPSASAFSQDEKIELRMAWWGSQNRHDRTIAVIELYKQLNPNVEIIYEPSGWDDHWTKLATQAAGGDLPDIIQQDYARINEWVTNDLLLPLDEFVESGVIDVSNIADASLAGGRVDGKLYGFNLGNNSETFIIDVDAFEQAGLELPAVDWTWADFEEIALQLHEKLGIYVIGGNLHLSEHWKGVYISCCDAYAYNAEGNGLGYTEEQDQYFVDYLHMLLRLIEAGAIPTIEETTARVGTSTEESYIVTQQAVMEYGWSNMLVAIWTAAGEERNFVEWTVPGVGNYPRNYIKPSMFFSISKQSKHAEEAAKFIDFFTNSVEANQILLAERGVPISSAVREALMPELGPAQQAMFDFLSVVEGYNSPIRPPDPAGHADVNNNVYIPQVVEPILYGMLSPEEGVQLLRDEAEIILAQ